MMLKSLHVLTAIAVAMPSPARAAEPAETAALDKCLKSVNIIGASIGHKEKAGPDGKTMLHFVVRSNGADYDVKCEAETGMVKDVSTHIRGEVTAN
jgi:hypothetical protein